MREGLPFLRVAVPWAPIYRVRVSGPRGKRKTRIHWLQGGVSRVSFVDLQFQGRILLNTLSAPLSLLGGPQRGSAVCG